LKKQKGWQKQKTVLDALFLRELKARFTSGQAGLFWTFFQPFFMVFLFVTMHVIMHGSDTNSNSAIEYGIFIALSFTSFFLFRDLLTKSSGAFRANKALFIYRQVKPIDTLIARLMVESFIMGVVILGFVILAVYFDLISPPKNLIMVTLGYLWLTIFGFGIGLIIAVANTFYDVVGKIVGFLNLPLLFLSALFYSIESIAKTNPEAAQMLLYNPIVHFMEMIHGFYFYDLDDRYVDYNYMALWTATTLFIGLWLYINLERKIVSTS